MTIVTPVSQKRPTMELLQTRALTKSESVVSIVAISIRDDACLEYENYSQHFANLNPAKEHVESSNAGFVSHGKIKCLLP